MLKIKKLYYGISRFHVSEFMNSVKNELNTGFLLDAGAGDCPYRKLFLSHKYESCEKKSFEAKTKHTFYCDLESIPRPSGFYDVIICNQVLEHVPDPNKVVNEFYRVLKPGGQIVVTVPQCYGLHMSPENYFNFLEFGIKHVFEKNKFEIIKIVPLGGIFSLIGKVCDEAICVLIRKIAQKNIQSIALKSFKVINIPFLYFCIIFDLFDKEKKWTLNYGVLAKK